MQRTQMNTSQEHSSGPPDHSTDEDGFEDTAPPLKNASLEEKRLYS